LPLYEYRCTQCGNRYEKIQKVSETPDTACPKCGGKVERPLTAPALQFKGAGWYINDYAAKPAGGSNSESKPTESKPAESTPAAEAKAPSDVPSSPKPTASGNS